MSDERRTSSTELELWCADIDSTKLTPAEKITERFALDLKDALDRIEALEQDNADLSADLNGLPMRDPLDRIANE